LRTDSAAARIGGGTLIGGRYWVIQSLGAGGMAEVWEAEDLELGRRVAVKLLAPQADPLRFRREAQAVAALSHPNVIRLYQFGELDGRPYLVFEYLSGGTLEDRLAPGRPLADADTARIAAEIAGGLAHAHTHGVVHRDLKPSNILFDDEDRAKLADFGIARAPAQDTLTEDGTLLGTAGYISPEQAAGERATPASDVYAFGVLLFQMLAGRLPFEADSPLGLVLEQREEPAPAVTELRPDAPPALARLTAAALSPRPADRPADGAALADSLAAEQAATPPLPAERATGRRLAPRSGVALAAVAAVLALLGGGAAVLASRHHAAVPAQPSGSPPQAKTSATRARARTTATTASAPATTSTTQSRSRPSSTTGSTSRRAGAPSTRRSTTTTAPSPTPTSTPGSSTTATTSPATPTSTTTETTTTEATTTESTSTPSSTTTSPTTTTT
jgi:serine/threonine-protein kinase